MSIPDDLRYTREHEWARGESDGSITVGITHHAQENLGDVVYVELPEVGSSLGAGDTFGVVESVKAVSDLFSPITGEVAAVNEALPDAPETINADCYGAGWLIRLTPSASGELEGLMSAADYAAFCAEESH